MSGIEEAIESLLLAVEDALDDGDLDRANEGLRAMQEMLGSRDGRVLRLYGLLRWEVAGPRHALPALRDAVAVDAEDGEALHSLARALEEVGEADEAIRHNLRVLRLDAARDVELGLGSDEELDFIEGVAFEVLERMADPFRERLAAVPVILEQRPSNDLVRDGFDPRAFGLFEGPPCHELGESGDTPPRIVLFTNNLLASCPEEAELARQVEITILHEVGHYFGLAEADMPRLGLE
jgi:predicted Zn-dependent protease with MMP-like domain